MGPRKSFPLLLGRDRSQPFGRYGPCPCRGLDAQASFISQSLLGLLPIFAMPKSRHTKKIWLSFGSCLEICHCNQNFGKLLETSETLKEKRLLVGTKPNEYLIFLLRLWRTLILVSQYIGLP